ALQVRTTAPPDRSAHLRTPAAPAVAPAPPPAAPRHGPVRVGWRRLSEPQAGPQALVAVHHRGVRDAAVHRTPPVPPPRHARTVGQAVQVNGPPQDALPGPKPAAAAKVPCPVVGPLPLVPQNRPARAAVPWLVRPAQAAAATATTKNINANTKSPRTTPTRSSATTQNTPRMVSEWCRPSSA